MVQQQDSDEIFINSMDFFLNEVGADESIFSKYPLLGTFKVEGDLRPKYNFFRNYIGMKSKKIAKTLGVFTNPLDLVYNRFLHYFKKFNWNEEQVKALFRKADSIPGYDTATIDDKIDKYERSNIDFHQNYSLLEKDPLIVIDTRDYLKDELFILPPHEGMDLWYYMLLTISKETIKPKVEYCNYESIPWENAPKVLILGLGTKKQLGALPRRVKLIKKEFKNKKLHSLFDYKEKPLILTNPDNILKNRIKAYR